MDPWTLAFDDPSLEEQYKNMVFRGSYTATMCLIGNNTLMLTLLFITFPKMWPPLATSFAAHIVCLAGRYWLHRWEDTCQARRSIGHMVVLISVAAWLTAVGGMKARELKPVTVGMAVGISFIWAITPFYMRWSSTPDHGGRLAWFIVNMVGAIMLPVYSELGRPAEPCCLFAAMLIGELFGYTVESHRRETFLNERMHDLLQHQAELTAEKFRRQAMEAEAEKTRLATELWCMGNSCESSSAVVSSETRSDANGAIGVVKSLSIAQQYHQYWVPQGILGIGQFGRAVLLKNVETGESAACKQVWAGPNKAPLADSDFKVDSLTNEPTTQDSNEVTAMALANLEREVSVLASLPPHPNVIRYRACFLQGDFFCLITDYAAGGTLQQQIAQRRDHAQPQPTPFPMSTVLTWTAQLITAIDWIHSKGVLHRDIKPSNIFLSATMEVKLGDFGLARTSILASTACGTPYFMSPEQIRGDPYTCPADVWAFGCVLFELLTLKRAFQADSLTELARMIEEDRQGACQARHLQLLRSCRVRAVDPAPEGLLALLLPDALLHRDPKQRTTLDEAASVLRPLLSALNLPALTPSMAAQPPAKSTSSVTALGSIAIPPSHPQTSKPTDTSLTPGRKSPRSPSLALRNRLWPITAVFGRRGSGSSRKVM